MKKRVMFYCQHVLGMGHLVRSLEIVKALDDFSVTFVNGGELLEGFQVPASVEVVNLPPIKSDGEFEELHAAQSGQSLADIQEIRKETLLNELVRLEPDFLIIELFPFGRMRFANELIPLLARVRLDGFPTKVVCSLRDILVAKSDQVRHEEWVCSVMNRYFDLLLVHSDPKFQVLEETFSRVGDLKCSIQYTGFVSQKLPAEKTLALPYIPPAPVESPVIIASIGGGRVGCELLECVIQATTLIQHNLPCRVLIFTGPYLPDEQFLALKELLKESPHVSLQRYTADFLEYLRIADLSISMAGYNTCMNIIATGIKSIVLPFTGRGNEEQTIRAQKLETLGVVRLISPEKLNPENLGNMIVKLLSASWPVDHQILDTNGAQVTASLLEDDQPQSGRFPSPLIHENGLGHKSDWQREFISILEDFQETGKEVRVFLRDDDIDCDEDTLRTLADITISHGVPLNLEVIPGTLTPQAIRFIKNLKRIDPTLIELNQHGWKHTNHEAVGRKCEFGPSRSYDEQYNDIANGKRIMEDAFPLKFSPVFTPPWNRCTRDTFKVLDELGFQVLSKDQGKESLMGYGFAEMSTTLDLYRWKEGPSMKSPLEIIAALKTQMTTLHTVGILLHHKVMDEDAFGFFDRFLHILKQTPNVQFHTFQTLLQIQNEDRGLQICKP